MSRNEHAGTGRLNRGIPVKVSSNSLGGHIGGRVGGRGGGGGAASGAQDPGGGRQALWFCLFWESTRTVTVFGARQVHVKGVCGKLQARGGLAHDLPSPPGDG